MAHVIHNLVHVGFSFLFKTQGTAYMGPSSTFLFGVLLVVGSLYFL